MQRLIRLLCDSLSKHFDMEQLLQERTFLGKVLSLSRCDSQILRGNDRYLITQQFCKQFSHESQRHFSTFVEQLLQERFFWGKVLSLSRCDSQILRGNDRYLITQQFCKQFSHESQRHFSTFVEQLLQERTFLGKVFLALSRCDSQILRGNDRYLISQQFCKHFSHESQRHFSTFVLHVRDLLVCLLLNIWCRFRYLKTSSKIIVANPDYSQTKEITREANTSYLLSKVIEVFEPTFFTTKWQRLGEALNPGPLKVDQFRIEFVNPTTVLNRETSIMDLDLDLLGMAETSATRPVQNQVQLNLKKAGYTCHWSHPVDNHRPMINAQISMRGVASGVAVVSRIPTRQFRDPLPALVTQSSRAILVYAQLGATTILTATFYGFAAGNDHARQETNNLLEVIVEILLAHPGPAVLMGDFNHDPESLPALEKLQQAGYQSIRTIHQSIFQTDMPKTYQEATTRDLMFFSTELAGHVTDIQVPKDTPFPGHCPVIVELSLPLGGLTKKMWRTPKNFLDLTPSKAILEHQYAALPPLVLQSDAMLNLKNWSQKVEKAVDATIRCQHRMDPDAYPCPALPSQYQGKCQSEELRTGAFRAFTPKARVNDFEPDMEVRSIAARQQVRQVRRIQSLRRRFMKLQTYTEVWETTWKGLQQEWAAILKAPGFGKSFVHWVCTVLNWPFVTAELPRIHMLEALEEAVIVQLKHTLNDDKKRFQQQKYINHQIDHLYNFDRVAYNKVKEPPLQFIQSLSTVFDRNVTVIDQDQKFIEVQGDFDTIPTIGTIASTTYGDLIVLDSSNTQALLKWKQLPDFPIVEVGQCIRVSFRASGMQPKDIHVALTNYWQPLWNRDTYEESQNENCWTQISEHLQQHPIPKITEHFDISSLDLWKTVIKNTNSKSAPGADGWYFDELKILPDQAIVELIKVFEDDSFQGFEAPHMRARIVPLPKKTYVDTPDQTRPISVMPTLYRVWSAVVAHQIMQEAHHILPEGIVGFVKGRSGLQSMHKLAWHIEKTRFLQQHASGLTLDLTKAFNQFPRVPVTMILSHMGAPKKYLTSWLNSLTAMEKFFDHRNWISEPLLTTTGVVEGDSLSVVGMIGIAAFWWHTITVPGIHPMAYADNLSWYADSFHLHRKVLQDTIQVFRMLRIPIGWNKTWIWGTSKADYRSWEQLATDVLPEGVTLQPMHSAVDLGVVIYYSSNNKLLKIADRLKDAMQRLTRLNRQHLSIDVMAKIIQTAVWPKAFYGQELHLLGRHHFTELRSQAARTLLQTTNPGMASLALVFAGSSLDDPEIYVTINAVRAAKALLWNMTLAEQMQFLRITCQSSGVCANTKGPASALKGYLMRLGVQITPTGDLHFVSGVVLNLKNTPFQVLRQHIRDEWLRDLPLLTSERASVRNAPMIHRRLTQQTLAKFHPSKKLGILREICHTFQLQQQKKHWTEDTSDQCPHCTALDSRRHRATQCEALKDVYQAHEPVIRTLEDLHDIHFDLPVIFCSPLHDMLLQCNYNPADTAFVPDTVNKIQQQLDAGIRPVFFSDGSCFGNTTPGMSIAAWALVLGLATSPEEVARVERLGNNPHNLSSWFLTVAVDRCHGEQTIDRAELWAMLKLHERWNRTILITDSEYANSSWQLVQQVTQDQQLIFRPNADLLIRLRRAQVGADHEVIKVQSHQLDGKTPTTSQRFYHTLGNMVVDTIAKQTNQMLSRDMVQQWQVEYTEILQQQQMRKAHYDLLLDIQPVRATLEHNSRTTRSFR